MTPGGIFDLLRNYGPLITVKLEDVVGEATVTFYQREDALKAQNELHGSQLAGE